MGLSRRAVGRETHPAVPEAALWEKGDAMKRRRLAWVVLVAAAVLAAGVRAAGEEPAPPKYRVIVVPGSPPDPDAPPAAPPPPRAPGTPPPIPPRSGAASEQPSPPPDPSPPAVAAPPGTASADKTVILPMPSSAPMAYGSPVEFAEKAFPILGGGVVEADPGVRSAQPLPCNTCRGQGVVLKKDSLFVPNIGMREPMAKEWTETCTQCGGFRDMYDPRYAARVLGMIGQVARLAPGAGPNSLRPLAAERLRDVLSVRDRTFITYACEAFRESEVGAAPGPRPSNLIITRIGIRLKAAKQVTFTMDVADLVAPVWRNARTQPPTGQAVLVVGTAGHAQVSGEWTVMRLEGELPRLAQPQLSWTVAPAEIRPDQDGRPGSGPLPTAPKTPVPRETAPAILLCERSPACSVPEGRVVVGGLLVGRWAPPDARTPPCPVILAVVAAQARPEPGSPLPPRRPGPPAPGVP